MRNNASHYEAAAARDYLTEVHAEMSEQDWPITGCWFAPHDPGQNPIADIWSQARPWVRQQWAHLTGVQGVISAFE